MDCYNPEPYIEIGCQHLMASGCSHSGVLEKEVTALARFTTSKSENFTESLL